MTKLQKIKQVFKNILTTFSTLKTDGLRYIPLNVLTLYSIYKVGPLRGTKRMFPIFFISFAIAALLIESYFLLTKVTLVDGSQTSLFTTTSPLIRYGFMLILSLFIYFILSAITNNLIALFKAYFFLSYSVKEKGQVRKELKTANNQLLKRIDPSYKKEESSDSVVILRNKEPQEQTPYRPYLQYEPDGTEVKEQTEPYKDRDLDAYKDYLHMSKQSNVENVLELEEENFPIPAYEETPKTPYKPNKQAGETNPALSLDYLDLY